MRGFIVGGMLALAAALACGGDRVTAPRIGDARGVWHATIDRGALTVTIVDTIPAEVTGAFRLVSSPGGTNDSGPALNAQLRNGFLHSAFVGSTYPSTLNCQMKDARTCDGTFRTSTLQSDVHLTR